MEAVYSSCAARSSTRALRQIKIKLCNGAIQLQANGTSAFMFLTSPESTAISIGIIKNPEECSSNSVDGSAGIPDGGGKMENKNMNPKKLILY
ncbi:MAG: hypothetical protein ABSA23_16030 [Anaerolineales bacterium]